MTDKTSNTTADNTADEDLRVCNGELFCNRSITVGIDGSVYHNGNLLPDENGWVRFPNLRKSNGRFQNILPEIYTQSVRWEYMVNRLALYTYYYHRVRSEEELHGLHAVMKDPNVGYEPGNVRWSDEEDERTGQPPADCGSGKGSGTRSKGGDDDDEAGDAISSPSDSGEEDIADLITKLYQRLAISPGDHVQIAPPEEEGGKPQIKVLPTRTSTQGSVQSK